jgi:hypothetical protein
MSTAHEDLYSRDGDAAGLELSVLAICAQLNEASSDGLTPCQARIRHDT